MRVTFADTGRLTMAGRVRGLTELIREKLLATGTGEGAAWETGEVADEFVLHASRFLERNLEVLKKLGES